MGKLVCPDVARPHVTINRILKRMHRDGYITQIPQPKDSQYLYMPNPVITHTQSPRLKHFLGLVDLYISLGKPEIYEVEPKINDEYQPDVYMRLGDSAIIVEYQRSLISNKKMQEKVNMFARSNRKREHDARTLWIISDFSFKIDVPPNLSVVQKKESAVS